MNEMIQDTSSQKTSDYVELSFSDLLKIIWKGKVLILIFTLTSGLLTTMYAQSLPFMYTSTGQYIPAVQEGSGTVTGQMSGLAQLAGLTVDGVGGDLKKWALGIKIIASKKFLMDFLVRREALNDLGKLGGWEMTKEQWNAMDAQEQNNFLHSASDLFRSYFKCYSPRTTPFIFVEVTHVSPTVAKQWVDWLVEDLNKLMMEEDVLEARKSIEYLQKEAGNTSIMDLRMLFYAMIQGHIKTTMLANVREEYVFKTVDPPLVPLGPSGPNKDKMIIWGTVGGALIGLGMLMLLYFFGYELKGLVSLRPHLKKLD